MTFHRLAARRRAAPSFTGVNALALAFVFGLIWSLIFSLWFGAYMKRQPVE